MKFNTQNPRLNKTVFVRIIELKEDKCHNRKCQK